MGLFQQRPEEPTEWAGLPSEPLREESAAERLAEGGGPGGTAVDSIPGAGLEITIGSITIPVSVEIGDPE